MFPMPPQLAVPLEIAKRLPWKWIGIGVAVILTLIFFWRVGVWHDVYAQVEEMRERVDTITKQNDVLTKEAEAREREYAQQTERTAKTIEADRKVTEEVERGLQTKIAAADATARDLARRLRDYQSGRRGCALPAPTAAAPVGTTPGGEPGDGDGTEQLVAEHFAACARDAEALNAWNDWWDGIEAGRVAVP